MTKNDRYERITKQLQGLFTKTNNLNARMATTCALLHYKFPYYFWTGFYKLIAGDLIVQTYQGPLACLRLEKNKGVCWTAINQKKTIIVPEVDKFPGHIACDSRSKSEIVVPLFVGEEVIAVLDIDSKNIASFDEEDKHGLEMIMNLLING